MQAKQSNVFYFNLRSQYELCLSRVEIHFFAHKIATKRIFCFSVTRQDGLATAPRQLRTINSSFLTENKKFPLSPALEPGMTLK